jgi:catechol 2,3-dioxygenase-like lactoylglutathione lyase family enzyme
MGLSDCRVEALLPVSDLDRAKRFYERQLGLVPGEAEDDGVHYPCAHGTGINVYLSAENAGRSPATLAGWFVDDLDQTMDELASRGRGLRTTVLVGALAWQRWLLAHASWRSDQPACSLSPVWCAAYLSAD